MSQHDTDPIETLRAELSRVEVSPDFSDRVRRQIGEDVIASIGAELSDLSVSPAFAVRVRQQIEEAPPRSPWFGAFNWRWAVPVAAAAAIAAIAVMPGGTQKTTGVVDQARVQARVNEPQVQKTPPVAAPVAQQPPSRQIAPARVNQRTTPSAAASGQQADDKLEVITYQPAVYRQLWAAAAAAQVGSVAELPVEIREVAVTPVEVGPVVVKWLVEPPVSGGGATPNIRRVSAAAERSEK